MTCSPESCSPKFRTGQETLRAVRAVLLLVLAIGLVAGAAVVPDMGAALAQTGSSKTGAPAQTESSTEASNDQQSKKVTITLVDVPSSDDRVAIKLDFKTKLYIIDPPEGYVKISYEDTTIVSDRVEWNDEERTAIITGNLRVTTKDGLISADKLTAWFEEDRYLFEGNVKLVQYETEEAAKTDSGDGTGVKIRLIAPVVEYTRSPDRFEASGGVQVEEVQENRFAWADKITFDDEKQTLWLTGNARIESENGNFTGEKFFMDLENQVLEGFGATSGEIQLD